MKLIKAMKFWGPDSKDNMRNRRNLAFFSAIFSLIIWPHELILLNLMFDLELELVKSLLVYVGTVAGTSIGGYIWSSLKDDVKNVAPASSKKSD